MVCGRIGKLFSFQKHTIFFFVFISCTSHAGPCLRLSDKPFASGNVRNKFRG